jgi:hypothetical protein
VERRVKRDLLSQTKKEEKPMKVKDFLDNPEQWTKGCWARDANGESVTYFDHRAVSRCLAGWVNWCYLGDYKERDSAWDKIDREIGAACTALWNDAPERTFEDVKALVEKLDV